MANKFDLNRHIGCIETKASFQRQGFHLALNRHIGCIETGKGGLKIHETPT